MIVLRNNDRTSPVVTESSLSYKAMGMLMLVLTHPTPGLLTLDDLCDAKTDNKDSVLEGLTELYKAGYLLFFRWKTPGGKWVSEYLVFESLKLRDRYLRTLPNDKKKYITSPMNQRGVA